MEETKVLLEEWSPICDIQAFVEDNGETVYLYLWVHPGREDAQIRNCWVCNTVQGSEGLDYDAMNSGRAPRMPLESVAHAPEGIRLDEDALSIIWFEEGDGVALYENEQILAVIPGWSGQDFSGYSIHARGMGPFAWELESALPVLEERMKRCRTYWAIMDSEYFGEMQQAQLAAMEAFFGPHRQYFAIDKDSFPPRALVTGEKDGNLYAFTLGNGALAQPLVEQYYGDETYKYRRFELGASFPADWDKERRMAVLNYMAAQVSLPWKELTWLGHGHTIPCDIIPDYKAVMLVNPAQCETLHVPKFPKFMGEPVNLLWMKFLTEEEYQIGI